MESISKRSGKKFTGKFASTAVRLGLATPSGEKEEVKPKVKTPPKTASEKVVVPKKEEEVKPKVVNAPAKAKVEEKPAGNADKTIMVSDQVKEAVSVKTKGTQVVKKPAGLKNPLTAKK